VAALLSLLTTKHVQKGDRHLNKFRACPSGSELLKDVKNQKKQK